MPDDSRPYRAVFPRRWSMIGFAIGLLLAVGFGLMAGDYYLNVAALGFLSLILAVSLRLLMLAGEAALCHGAFYAFGAYTTGILTTQHGVPFWITVPLGGLVAVCGALVIGLPSFRTSGSYFLLMTFAFLIVATSLMESWTGLTGGFSGIVGIPSPPAIESVGDWYWLTAVLATVVLAFFIVLERSRWGLELKALGQSRELAQSIGIAPGANMLLAFAVGAFFAGVAGTFYAGYVSFIAPSSFSFWLSVYVMMYVIIGGTRYLLGTVVGTAVLVSIPIVADWSENYVAIFTAAATLVILMALPRGMVTAAAARLDLQGRAADPGRANLLRTSATSAGSGSGSGEDEIDESRPVAEGVSQSLRLRNVSKSFGGLRALDDVTFEARMGETLGVIGPNGAGKTTLFNLISGFDTPTEGSIVLGADRLDGARPTTVVRRGLTRTFQHSSVFGELSVLDNLTVACREQRAGLVQRLQPIRRDPTALGRARSLLDQFGLTEWAHVDADALPYGARKRLGVAIGMATRPRLLLLDEPMAGLTDVEVHEMTELLRRLARSGETTIVLIEHRMSAVVGLCDRLVVLDFGRVIADGSPQEVIENPQVVEAYLGGPAEVDHG